MRPPWFPAPGAKGRVRARIAKQPVKEHVIKAAQAGRQFFDLVEIEVPALEMHRVRW